MKQLASILDEFLGAAASGETNRVTFGEGNAGEKKGGRIPPSLAAMDRLTERLERQVGFNNRIIVSIVSAYLLVLLLSAVLVSVHHNEIGWVGGFAGGSILGLLAVGTKLLELWREKNYMDMLLALLPTLAPAEAARLIETFYLEKIKRPSRKRPKPALPATL